MATSSAFYLFTHVTPSGERYAIAYKPPGPIERGAYEDLVLTMCRGPRIPDAVIVVAVKEDQVDVLSDLQHGTAQVAQERLRGRIPFCFASYEIGSGKVDVTLLDPTFAKKGARLKTVLQASSKWIQSGLLRLFDENVVVLRAPPGYVYEKPSGGRVAVFLKPNLAFTSSASVAFVALGLFQKVFSGKLSNFPELRTVFVDTMAIAPVAYELRQLFGLCRPSSPFHIESFHSYGGFEGVDSPMTGTSLCIISASTSMDLHERWIREKEVSPSEVVTLLTLKSAKKYKAGALVAIDCTGLDAADGPVQLSIRIRGETFLPEQESAKKVLLTEKDHGSPEDINYFHRLTGNGVFDIFRREPRSAAKVRALYVNGEALLEEPLFKEWLPEQLFQTVKASTKVIVHQNDKASKVLAETIAVYCRETLGIAAPVLVSAETLTEARIPKSSGVVICAAVIGKGSQLLEVSRTLRDLHEGPRLFVIGFQVAESRSEIRGLTLNLKHSKSVVPHDIVRFGSAAIGTQLLESYELERATFYSPSSDLNSLPELLKRRAGALGGTDPIGDLALLPHGKAISNSMRLRPGFAFWPSVEDGPCQPTVIATIATLLQRAREEKLQDERRLSTLSYRQVVLDPENFARYNDGVIQAALLRAAYPSELDYRADRSSSDCMKAIIIRALDKIEAQAGEAALEFIAALSLKKVQLFPQHFDEIRAAITAAQKKSQPLARALKFLSTTGSKQKLPF